MEQFLVIGDRTVTLVMAVAWRSSGRRAPSLSASSRCDDYTLLLCGLGRG